MVFGIQLFFSLLGLAVSGDKVAEIAWWAVTDFQWGAVFTTMSLESVFDFILSVGLWAFTTFILPHLLDYIPWWSVPGFLASNTPPALGVKLLQIGLNAVIGMFSLRSLGCL